MENSHLRFYVDNNIAPTSQNGPLISVLKYREALYNHLGVHKMAIKGSDILEVACGTGENSAHIARNGPATLTLIEPNPEAFRLAQELYDGLTIAHTVPNIKACRIEDFDPTGQYDVVICENWLGASTYDRRIFQALLELCKSGSILVTTAISPIGILSNLLRRIISHRIARELPDDEVLGVLTALWSQHLNLLSGMTRSTSDWVLDNMINPAYLGILVTPADIATQVINEFDIHSTYPQFGQDFRWFKTLPDLTPKAKKTYFTNQYICNSHNFIDVKLRPFSGHMALNEKLESTCSILFSVVGSWEKSVGSQRDERWLKIVSLLKQISSQLHQIYRPKESAAMERCISYVAAEIINLNTIGSCEKFSRWFGRETIYMSILCR